MAAVALAEHVARGNIQGREQAGHSVELIVVGAALQLSGAHGQHRLASPERLNLALLVHTQHQGTMGRVQIQPHDVPHLVDQQRIAGELEVGSSGCDLASVQSYAGCG
jgi:hypothetical protein